MAQRLPGHLRRERGQEPLCPIAVAAFAGEPGEIDQVQGRDPVAGEERAVGAVLPGHAARPLRRLEVAALTHVPKPLLLLALQADRLVQPALLAGGRQQLQQAADEQRVVAQSGRPVGLAGEVKQRAPLRVDAVIERALSCPRGGLAVARRVEGEGGARQRRDHQAVRVGPQPAFVYALVAPRVPAERGQRGVTDVGSALVDRGLHVNGRFGGGGPRRRNTPSRCAAEDGESEPRRFVIAVARALQQEQQRRDRGRADEAAGGRVRAEREGALGFGENGGGRQSARGLRHPLSDLLRRSLPSLRAPARYKAVYK